MRGSIWGSGDLWSVEAVTVIGKDWVRRGFVTKQLNRDRLVDEPSWWEGHVQTAPHSCCCLLLFEGKEFRSSENLKVYGHIKPSPLVDLNGLSRRY